jgi:hypothetical protein
MASSSSTPTAPNSRALERGERLSEFFLIGQRQAKPHDGFCVQRIEVERVAIGRERRAPRSLFV